MPLRYLILTLTKDQRVELLREVFVAIFADDDHPNPKEAYAIFRLYISYFTLKPRCERTEFTYKLALLDLKGSK